MAYESLIRRSFLLGSPVDLIFIKGWFPPVKTSYLSLVFNASLLNKVDDYYKDITYITDYPDIINYELQKKTLTKTN